MTVSYCLGPVVNHRLDELVPLPSFLVPELASSARIRKPHYLVLLPGRQDALRLESSQALPQLLALLLMAQPAAFTVSP